MSLHSSPKQTKDKMLLDNGHNVETILSNTSACSFSTPIYILVHFINWKAVDIPTVPWDSLGLNHFIVTPSVYCRFTVVWVSQRVHKKQGELHMFS